MGIQINGQTDSISAIDGSLSIQGASGNITATGLSGTPNITVGSIIASSATISGNVSVAGTVTYEDVTNVDSIGVVTARSGVVIGTGASISSPATNVLTFGVNNTEKVRINTTGVGIGTTNPDQLLSIQSTGDAQISFKNTSGVSKAYVGTSGAFGSASTDDLRIRSDSSNIIFGFNGSESARITSSGYVAIGVTSPSTKLYVEGDATVNGILYHPNSSQVSKGQDHTASSGTYTIGSVSTDYAGVMFVTGNHNNGNSTRVYLINRSTNGSGTGLIGALESYAPGNVTISLSGGNVQASVSYANRIYYHVISLFGTFTRSSW